MRNKVNYPIYQQAEALPLTIFVDLINDDRLEETEHAQYAFMA